MARTGAALVMAIVAAIVVSLTAVVAMNFTFQRFHLSHFRADRMAAFSASEAGLRYAFKRLEINDTNPLTEIDNTKTFQEKVQDKFPDWLTISSSSSVDTDPDTPGEQTGSPDHLEPNLRMGEKNVTVWILHDPTNAPDPTRPYRIRASSAYGT